MGDQNQNGTTESTESKPKEETSHGSSILATIKDLVDNSGAEVKERVINAFAEEKKAQRVETLKKGINKLTELRGQFSKLNRPDQCSYDGTGNKIETMSAAKFEEVKKAREALEKLEKAINLAVDKNDFSKLNELCK